MWCGREDSNFHGLSATATSTLRVYQFRHDRTCVGSSIDEFPWQGAATSKAVTVAQCAIRVRAVRKPSSPAGTGVNALFTIPPTRA